MLDSPLAYKPWSYGKSEWSKIETFQNIHIYSLRLPAFNHAIFSAQIEYELGPMQNHIT